MSRRTVVSVLSSCALLVSAAFSFAAPMAMPAEKTVIVQGTLVDTKCFSMNAMNVGQDHVTPAGEVKSCAKACAAMGLPVGIRTTKGQVFVLIAPVPAFTEYMAQTARVTGVKVLGGSSIRPTKVEVKDASGNWKEINIKTMM